MGNIKRGKRELMLDEVLFYSVCSTEDKEKILGQREMTFDDFRRLSLITDHLELHHLRNFIWDLYSYHYSDQIEALYGKCREHDQALPDMVTETGHWLNDFWEQAPNPTVAYLLRQLFTDGLE